MRKIKAISIHQPWASMIASGKKTIETINYATRHRGELLICSTKAFCHEPGLPKGKALCIVDLVDCRRMQTWDQEAAQCKIYPGAYSWVLKLIEVIEHPYPVTGRQGFYYVELPDALRTRNV